MVKSTAKVQVKDSKGAVIAFQDYEKLNFEGAVLDDKGKPTGGKPEDLLTETITILQTEAGEKGNGALDMLSLVTYAYDLGVRAKIRQALVTAMAGPDKAFEKSVKDIMAMRAAAGKPITEEQARARVQKMMDEEMA